jgi:cholesterol transport system auxiliary component
MVFAVGSCASGRSYEEQYYILEAARPGEPGQAVAESLEVRRFSVDTAFAVKSLVYRLDEFEYETDYYRRFLIAPGVMMTEKVREWLATSGLFRRVLPSGSSIEPVYTLEGNVTALYGDFSDDSAPAAVVEIRFFLVQNAPREENVVFAQTYRAATPVQDRTAEIFVEALNRSLVEILTRLEADLRKALGEETRPRSVS